MVSDIECNSVQNVFKQAYRDSPVAQNSRLVEYIQMLDIFWISYDGAKRRPTFEEVINFVDYLVEFLDGSATFARDSPLLT